MDFCSPVEKNRDLRSPVEINMDFCSPVEKNKDFRSPVVLLGRIGTSVVL